MREKLTNNKFSRRRLNNDKYVPVRTLWLLTDMTAGDCILKHVLCWAIDANKQTRVKNQRGLTPPKEFGTTSNCRVYSKKNSQSILVESFYIPKT